MIKLRDGADRIHSFRTGVDVWQCVQVDGFSDLAQFEEQLLAPDSMVLDVVHQNVLYVCEGALEVNGLPGSPEGIATYLFAGAFERVLGVAIRPRKNPSEHASTRIFCIRMKPLAGDVDQRGASKWFGQAERRGRLVLVASSERSDDTLFIPQDARVYSSVLAPGQHVVCLLAEARCGWLHMVRGSATVSGTILEASDSAEVTAVSSFSVTARGACEVLMFDLAARAPRLLLNGVPRPNLGKPTAD